MQFDQDVNAFNAQAFPQLYRPGIEGKEYTRLIFFSFMGDGLYQSVIAFYVPYLVYNYATTLSVTGHDFSQWELGTTIAACAVTLCNVFVGLHIRYWTWMVWAIIVGSTLAFHVWICIYSQFDTFTMENELICKFRVLQIAFARGQLIFFFFFCAQTSTRLLTSGRRSCSPSSPGSDPSTFTSTSRCR